MASLVEIDNEQTPNTEIPHSSSGDTNRNKKKMKKQVVKYPKKKGKSLKLGKCTTLQNFKGLLSVNIFLVSN